MPHAASSNHTRRAGRALTDGFIQFDDHILDHLDAEDWVALLQRFRAQGRRTLILQRLGLAVDNESTPPGR